MVKIPADYQPKYNWGHVQNGDVGTLLVSNETCFAKVDFPRQRFWSAGEGELFYVEEGLVYNYLIL